MSTDIEPLRKIVEPALSEAGLDCYDVALSGPGGSRTLQIMVTSPEGVDLGAITQASRIVSRALDDADPMAEPYVLEVSSPGLERPLRTPEHFASAVGAAISVKHRAEDGTQRTRGTLLSVSDAEIVVRPDGDDAGDDADGRVHIRVESITKARTVLEWAPAPKPGAGSRPGRSRSGHDAKESAGR